MNDSVSTIRLMYLFFIDLVNPLLYHDPDKIEIVSFTPDQGMIGDTITLKGKNFSPYPTSNHVSFAGELPNAEILAEAVRVASFSLRSCM